MNQKSVVIHFLRAGLVPKDLLRHLVDSGVITQKEIDEQLGADEKMSRQEWSSKLAEMLEDRELEVVEEVILDKKGD